MQIRLREIRERRMLSQGELAQRAGMTKATISRLETGIHGPRYSTVRRLAEALNVELSELVIAGGEAGE